MAIIANSSTGLYNFRNELLKKLSINNEIVAFTPDSGLVNELGQCGCRVINTPIDRRGMNLFVDFKLFFRYIKLLEKVKPDMVITYTIKPNIYGGFACRLKRIPYAVNITGLGTAFESSRFLRKMATIMYKVSCKNAKIVFFENEENRRLFIKYGIVKKNRTYRLNGAGVNLDKYQVTEYPRGNIIKFLFIGRIMAEKGVDELFIAMEKLVADGIKCQLDVLGGYEENYKEKLEKYELEGWLHYHGYQRDVRPFIQNSHCFVLPSWHEGMANTNLECAASGRPVITSNIHGCLEAVIDGKTGYLVERKNADDLYRVMKKLVALSFEERKAMGLAGRKHMETFFDKKKVVQETISKLY